MKIKEIFYSIQGEGYWTGTPAIFIRLAGCNRHCTWCDTDHEEYSIISESDILEEVERMTAEGVKPAVVLTGGEPTLQDISTLTTMLRQSGYRIHLETNGSFSVIPDVDWITASPKCDTDIQNMENMPGLKVHELKIVYSGEDANYFQTRFTSSVFSEAKKFIQPCYGVNEKETIEMVKSLSDWRLSLQTHKMINIR